MKLYFSEYFIVENFITRDRNNTGGPGVKTWVLFVPGELDGGTWAPASSEGLLHGYQALSPLIGDQSR